MTGQYPSMEIEGHFHLPGWIIDRTAQHHATVIGTIDQIIE